MTNAHVGTARTFSAPASRIWPQHARGEVTQRASITGRPSGFISKTVTAKPGGLDGLCRASRIASTQAYGRTEIRGCPTSPNKAHQLALSIPIWATRPKLRSRSQRWIYGPRTAHMSKSLFRHVGVGCQMRPTSARLSYSPHNIPLAVPQKERSSRAGGLSTGRG